MISLNTIGNKTLLQLRRLLSIVNRFTLLPMLGKVALLLLLCATTVGGFLWLLPAQQFVNPPLARIVVFHVPCAIVADLASAVAGWYAIAYLRKRSLSDDVKSSVSFGLALLFCLLTTVTGAIFAKVQWGEYWNWDPREKTIFMLLLIYLAYFALRAAFNEPRKRAAISAAYALFGVAAVPFLTYILPNSTDLTLHPKNVINSRDGLDFGLQNRALDGRFWPEYGLFLGVSI